MSDEDLELLKRKISREQRARQEAEKLLEAKSRELYQRNQSLEQEISERERIERDLADKADALTRSNDELQQFAYVASHDLQAPLRNIVSFSRLLHDQCGDQLSENGREFLEFIRGGAMSMHALINDLLNLSRVETRGGELNRVSLSSVMDSVLAGLKTDLENSNAEIEFAELPEVLGDSSQLQQLLANLIGNAIKFVADGQQPRVAIATKESATEWLFSIKDNGIGIGNEHLSRIFVIFRRLHAPDEYPGTGIGLAICKKIVERHGGKIWATRG